MSAQAQRDSSAARCAEAEQSAAQAGIPFDKRQCLATEARADASRRAQQTLGREQMAGQVVREMAGERTQRLAIDLQRGEAENEQVLKRYGIDVDAYTKANQAMVDWMKAIGLLYSGLGGGGFSSSIRIG